MLIIENKPLIFLDNHHVDELSVEFRRINKMLDDTMLITHSDFTSLQDLIDEDSAITYGIVKCGEPDPDGIPVIKVENMRNDRSIDIDGLDVVSESISNTYARTILKAKDILISIKGTIGRVAEVPANLEDANITRDSALIRLKDKSTNDFIMLYLESELAQLQMTLHSIGAAVKGINLADLREVKVPQIASDDKNKVIIRYSVLKKLSEEIDSKSTQIGLVRSNQLDQIVELIAGEIEITKFPRPWFGRLYFLKPEAEIDRLDVLGANPQFEDECWTSGNFVPLSDVCEVEGSNEQIPLGTQRYISIEGLPGNYWKDIDLPEMEIDNQTGRTHFYPGDIAWAHLKPSILQGKAYIIHDECWGSHHFLKLNTSKVSENLRTIIWAYLKTGPIKRHLANKCTGKSESQKDVSDKALGMLPFPDLNDDQVKKMAVAIRDTIEKSHELEAQENAYKKKADSLLKKAKSNIFNLLDDSWFNDLVSEAKEALQ